MKKITLFYDGSWYTFKWLKPMLWAGDMFREKGYEVSFLNKEEYEHSHDKTDVFERDVNNNEFDIVFLAYHDSHKGLCSVEAARFERIMNQLRRHSNCIVWLDTSDSTGGIWKRAFPYIDIYLKKQVCKDFNNYKKRNWGCRIYTDYYQEKGIECGETTEYSDILSDDELRKIGISWNVGMGDLFGERDISYKNPCNIYTPDAVMPALNRKYDVQFRGTYDYSICGYQRNKSLELLEGMSSIVKNDMSTKICFEEYLKEIASSKTVISPYGWGEICSRDFETFLMGATLVKPDMSHMDTYPNWYEADETYVPTKWDFSDFEEKVLKTIHSDSRIEIANNAQNLFVHHRTTDEGKKEFVEHVISQINPHAPSGGQATSR